MWPWFMTDAYNEVWNYGRSGAGNEYIFLSFLDALNFHNIGPNDTVVMAWSTYARIDLYNKHGLQTHGNIFNNYDNEFIDKIWNPTAAVDKTWRYINAATELLLGRNTTFIHASLDDLEEIDLESMTYKNEYDFDKIKQRRYISDDVINHFIRTPLIKYFNNYTIKDNIQFIDQIGNPPRWDGHPLVNINNGIARDLIKPSLGVQSRQWIDTIAYDIHQRMCSIGTIVLPNFVDVINETWKCNEPLTKDSLPNYLRTLDYYIKNSLNNR